MYSPKLSGDDLDAWCRRQGYTFRSEGGRFAIDYALLGQPAALVVWPHFDRGMVMFVMAQPFSVPADRRPAVADALARLNGSSLMGAWVGNRDTGEVFFRATVPTEGITYSDESLLYVARVVVGTSEVAAPALRAIALDGADPAATIAALAPPRA